MGTYPGIDYFRLAEVLDVASWDNYPQWTGTEKDVDIAVHAAFSHDLMRGVKGKPFMLMESSPSATNWRPVAKLHRPGVHILQSMQAIAHGADTVQYFQFRKGRGSSEKFHGAIVDHVGNENTRVFHDVAQVGARLKTMDAVLGCDTPSRVALVFDWNNRWIIGDVKGFLQHKTGYEETVEAHYKAFWEMGVPVDIIDETRPLDGYDLVVAPMLYMLRPGFAEALSAFVEKGGTVVATYMTGYADEHDLVFRGGFPGAGLRKVFGIWNEEIDALYPEDRNALVLTSGASYEAVDLCERVHAEGAETLGTYGMDFYKGEPALTRNSFGKGKAYYIACRTVSSKDDHFLRDFYAKVIAECGVKPVLASPLPYGVTAQVRSDGETEHVFVMNFTPRAQEVDAGACGKKTLAPWEVWITERKA
jgi:beta-galactosidase